MNRLEGKVAIVTGASSGIGAATAQLFAREGAVVVAADVDDNRLRETTAGIERSGGAVTAVHLDVREIAQWERAVEMATRAFGRLDVLVNVAGVVDWSGIEATTEQVWHDVVAVNQTGTWLGMKVCMPALRETGNASIVNTSSILGLIGSGGAAAYHATKGAVRLLTKTAAVEYATSGVRVNSVHPGVIATAMIQDILDVEGNQQSDIQRTPMRRAGTPTEIAYAHLFLASDESSFVTGTELVVDGGITAH